MYASMFKGADKYTFAIGVNAQDKMGQFKFEWMSADKQFVWNVLNTGHWCLIPKYAVKYMILCANFLKRQQNSLSFVSWILTYGVESNMLPHITGGRHDFSFTKAP